MHFDQEEAFIQRELNRLNAHNDPFPEKCPSCFRDPEKGEWESFPGMVGEEMVFCKCGTCVWQDSEGAIRRVI